MLFGFPETRRKMLQTSETLHQYRLELLELYRDAVETLGTTPKRYIRAVRALRTNHLPVDRFGVSNRRMLRAVKCAIRENEDGTPRGTSIAEWPTYDQTRENPRQNLVPMMRALSVERLRWYQNALKTLGREAERYDRAYSIVIGLHLEDETTNLAQHHLLSVIDDAIKQKRGEETELFGMVSQNGI